MVQVRAPWGQQWEKGGDEQGKEEAVGGEAAPSQGGDEGEVRGVGGGGQGPQLVMLLERGRHPDVQITLKMMSYPMKVLRTHDKAYE